MRPSVMVCQRPPTQLGCSINNGIGSNGPLLFDVRPKLVPAGHRSTIESFPFGMGSVGFVPNPGEGFDVHPCLLHQVTELAKGFLLGYGPERRAIVPPCLP